MICENRRARYDYFIEWTLTAGIVLTGTEIKSLRSDHATITESYAAIDRNLEAWIYNSNIPEYRFGTFNNHEPKRVRKLLLNRREIEKLADASQREGMTIVPLKMYFNDRGRVKIDIAVAKGKKIYDKRQNEKKKEWTREKILI